MKKSLLLVLLVGLFIGEIMAQPDFNTLSGNRKEIVFTFSVGNQSKETINKLSHIISIDKVSGNEVTAYANEQEFEYFLEMNIDFRVVTPPSMLRQPEMMTELPSRESNDWDAYPTWDTYVAMMQQFVTDFPELCELVSIGTSTNGKNLYFIHINNQLGVDQNEPQFMYTSSIHGDELTGYVLMLRYIDYLLNNYGVDSRVTGLVDNIDIWINPLANPDGTFAGGNNTVYGATRSNAYGIDLNRNYADPDDGPHPDGNAYQIETQAFMDFAENHHFTMSSNFHGGAEVCNYPWDTWSKLHPDNSWWVYVCREYADTAQAHSPTGYLTDLNNGITNGYAWYTITGGRQDYMNYFHNCRELTIEISSPKTPPSAYLPNYWEYNYRSLLNYMEQSQYGIKGLITNNVTGTPIEAQVTMDDHDADNSWVYSGLPVGDYHRPIKEGNYNITYSAYGYYSKTFNSIVLQDQQAEVLNVQLDPITELTSDFTATRTDIGTNSPIVFTNESYGSDIISWNWTFTGGTPATSVLENPTGIMYAVPGVYDVKLKVTTSGGDSDTETKVGYIHVYDAYNMEDGQVTTCSAILYDNGGPFANYANNKNYTFTIYPAGTEKVVKLDFLEFDLEIEADCNYDYLKVYNGSDINSPILGTWCGTESPGIVISSSTEGALTLYFHSDDSENHAGWTALVSCDSNVGVVDNPEIEILFFPNPVTDLLQVQLPDKGMSQVFLTDITGRKVYEKLTDLKMLAIPVRDLKKGVYLITVITSNQKRTGKVVISSLN
ncbi:MAG: M14 family zinc carboxypeptidase [Bacteroidales bacterium]|nr:M14 family zinc carboxypeptidase [Bacteroidales bacterium]